MKKRTKRDFDSILLAAELDDSIIPADLHGMYVPEALREVDAVIDEAMMAGESSVRIVHGDGTGKLRKAVRAHLKTHEYVEAYRAAPGSRASGVTHAVVARK
ncbi:MAG TPA: Smr/MutS family protein [Patescibacteria group bacterium]|nr:Smr/MutS family protein [Patescibacteria group bacterium]